MPETAPPAIRDAATVPSTTATDVHHAGVPGFKGQIRLLMQRQSIHIRPQGEHLAGFTALQNANDTDLSDSVGLNSHFRQLLCHQGSGTDFMHGKFRVGMDIAADIDHPVDYFPGSLWCCHSFAFSLYLFGISRTA